VTARSNVPPLANSVSNAAAIVDSSIVSSRLTRIQPNLTLAYQRAVWPITVHGADFTLQIGPSASSALAWSAKRPLRSCLRDDRVSPSAAKPSPLWSARTCPRFRQATCRRPMRDGVRLNAGR
jgi:hypothetical protein